MGLALLHLTKQPWFEHVCVCVCVSVCPVIAPPLSASPWHHPGVVIHYRLHELFLHWGFEAGMGAFKGNINLEIAWFAPNLALCTLRYKTNPVSSLALNSDGCQTRSTNCGWRSISSRPGVGRSWRACTRGKSLLPKPCQPVHTPLSPHTHVFRAFCFLGPQNAVGAGHFSLTQFVTAGSALAALSLQQICPGVRHGLLRTAQPNQTAPDLLSNDKKKKKHWALFLFLHKGLGACATFLSALSPRGGFI